MATSNVNQSRYVDIRNDVAFKKIFTNQQMLIGLINSIITDFKIVEIEKIQTSDDITEKIKKLLPGKQEYSNRINNGRVIMDVVCTTDQGERIIIEMQNHNYHDFHDRSLFYTAIQICDQHNVGDEYYTLCPIYFIGFLDFEITPPEDDYITRCELCDLNTGKEWAYNRLHFIYVELPKFHLSAEECLDRLSRIVYSIKNTSKLKNIPKSFETDEYIRKMFIFAERNQLNAEEQKLYEMNLMEQMDYYAVLNCAKREAKKEGVAEGIEKGILQTAKNMLLAGIPVDVVIQCTGLTKKQVLAL